jgi:hypothetical protein
MEARASPEFKCDRATQEAKTQWVRYKTSPVGERLLLPEIERLQALVNMGSVGETGSVLLPVAGVEPFDASAVLGHAGVV